MNYDRTLIDAYLDGELTPEMEKRLAEWLAANPEHVRIFVRETHAHRAMRDAALARGHRAEFARELADAGAPASEPSAASTASLRRRTRRLRAQPARAFPRSFAGVLAAAACLAIAVLAFFLVSKPHEDPARVPTVARGTAEGRGAAPARAGVGEPEKAAPPVQHAPPEPKPVLVKDAAPPPATSQRSEGPALSRVEGPALSPVEGPTPPASRPAPEKESPLAATPAPATAATREPAPARASEPSPVVARIQTSTAGVLIERAGKKTPAANGTEVRASDTLHVPAKASAVAAYDDGTRLELDSDAALQFTATPAQQTVPSAPGAEPPGAAKHLFLRKGLLLVAAAKQPEGRPMLLETPHAEVAVVGTAFTISVSASATRLEVEEGRVRFTRRPDGASTEVAAGQYAVAAWGTTLAAKPLSEAAPTRVIEAEQLDSARGVKPADGTLNRPFLESAEGASGDRCLSVPGVGAEVSSRIALAPGLWHLWVRWFDDDEAKVSFEVAADGRTLGQATGEAKAKQWRWAHFTFRSKGESRIALRSTYEGLPAIGGNKRDYPYAAVNRWDRIVLTRDPNHVPQ